MIPTIDAWVTHLRAIAASDVDDRPLGVGELEAPFRAALGLREGVGPAPEGVRGELALWWGLLDDSIDIDAAIAAPTEGSLLPQGLFRAIEVWTEADLCSLHALWRLGRERDRPDWLARVADVRDWHLEHTQPDNATNRPWALHVFLLGRTVESEHYAATLLHNCQTVYGRPDPLSRLILRNAADELALV